MYDTLRFWTMSAADFLDEYFESEIVKAHFAGSSIIGTALGPRSPGTAYVLLHHYMGDIDDTVGRLGLRARRHGRDQQGARRLLRGQRRHHPQRRAGRADPGAQRPRLRRRAGGRRGNSRARWSFPIWTCAAPFSKPWTRRICRMSSCGRCRNFKIRGSSGKLNIALDGLPRFPAIPQGSPCTRGDMHVTDTIEMMERAYDDWKDGRWSRAPYIDMLIPSQIDPTMVPDGKHYMSVFVQYCPYELADGAVGRRQAPGLRRHRDQHHRAAQPEFQGPDPACGNPHALGHRKRGRDSPRAISFKAN